MPKSVVLVVLGALTLLALPLRARTPPDFSGAWILVPERCTPAGSAILGTEFKAAQDAAKLSLDLTSTRFARGAQPGPPAAGAPLPARTVFSLDGSDTVWRTPAERLPLVPSGQTAMTMLQSVHRAAWKGDQLVIVTRNTYRLTTNWGQPVVVTLRQTVWKTLALLADGTLSVGSLIVSDPMPGGPQPDAPVALSSIYKKSN